MAAGDTPISRRKSIKKSLRESFRRLRKGRSQRLPASPVKSPSAHNIHSPGNEPPTKPMERAIEARDESMTSMVRCVTLAKTYIVSCREVFLAVNCISYKIRI
jgi:lethal(2) giant larvae protein